MKPGGRLLVVDMLPHEREEYQHQMGHVWLGFSEKQMSRLLTGAGFDDIRMRALPADPDARGPALFVAVATRETAQRDAEAPAFAKASAGKPGHITTISERT